VVVKLAKICHRWFFKPFEINSWPHVTDWTCTVGAGFTCKNILNNFRKFATVSILGRMNSYGTWFTTCIWWSYHCSRIQCNSQITSHKYYESTLFLFDMRKGTTSVINQWQKLKHSCILQINTVGQFSMKLVHGLEALHNDETHIHITSSTVREARWFTWA
jgi:hypothetical protein